jgi:Protein of unknown function (DUF2846)
VTRAIISLLVPLLTASLFLGQDKTASSNENRNDSETCTIIFYREHHLGGSALRPSVYLDGKKLERLPNGRWFAVQVEPGKHQAHSNARFEPPIVIETVQGQTAYVKMTLDWAVPHGHGILHEVDPKKARSKIGKLKPLHNDKTN